MESRSLITSLYVLHHEGGSIYLLVYVDDLLWAALKTDKLLPELKAKLQAIFDSRDLGDAKCFNGIQLDRDRTAGTLKITQSRMIRDLLSTYGMEQVKHRATPLSPSTKLVKDSDSPLDTSKFPYSALIGSLLYISVCTRPDISQAVGALARYMANPGQEHWAAAKSVLRYLAGTIDSGITFKRSASGLQGFCDSDFAGDTDTRRSTTGYVFTLQGGAISWNSRFQPTVAASTTEAEYMAASSAVKEALWLRKLRADLGFNLSTVGILTDNTASLALLKNPVQSARSKHIDVHHHFARERVLRKEVAFQYISTADNISDCFTKPLPDSKFQLCCMGMGLL